MISPEEIRIYLPKYLSEETKDYLLNELKNFPNNIDKRIYENLEGGYLYQGDGIDNVLVFNVTQILSEIKTLRRKVLILSNSCDINKENKRLYQTRICYSPIYDLDKYENWLLEEQNDSKSIKDHIRDIRKQIITSIFYLPKGGMLEREGIVFLDQIYNNDIDCIDRYNLGKTRIFSLSTYGHYLFLFKLSIHFLRMQEKVDRN